MERMRTLSVQYPGNIPAVMNVAPELFEEEAKMAMAVKLFELGRLTSGQAAIMAGLSRIAFLLQCRRFGVASAEWSDEDLEQEFRTVL
jgi:predicted HTH domain antitoxin